MRKIMRAQNRIIQRSLVMCNSKSQSVLALYNRMHTTSYKHFRVTMSIKKSTFSDLSALCDIVSYWAQTGKFYRSYVYTVP